MNQVPFRVKTDLKLDSLSFLTLITKRQSHSVFCKMPLPFALRTYLDRTCAMSVLSSVRDENVFLKKKKK